jgi:hypothetical protein
MPQFWISVRRVIVGTRLSYWFAAMYSKWFLDMRRIRVRFAVGLLEGGLALRMAGTELRKDLACSAKGACQKVEGQRA